MNNKTLTITSLLSILMFLFHWAYDIVYDMSPGGMSVLFGIGIVVVWLYGSLVISDRRSGQIIMLLGGALGMVALVLHLRGAGLVGGRMAHANGVFFWVWTILALGATSAFSIILAVRALMKTSNSR